MKVLILLAALLAISVADKCDRSFRAFLKSLKDEIDKKGNELHKEYRDDYLKLVRQCFADSIDNGSKCALTDDEMNGDVYGEDGPLRNCIRCQSFFKPLRHGKQDKDMANKESVQKCFRSRFAHTIQEELEPCIQGKISNWNTFKMPPIPDFGEKAFSNNDIIEQGIDYQIVARNRLETCQIVNPAKYQSTMTCMTNEFPGIYSKNCAAVKAAKNATVSDSCSGRFEEVRNATCQCMDEKRADWRSRFTKIQDIFNSSQSAIDCGKQISDVLGTWLTKSRCWERLFASGIQ